MHFLELKIPPPLITILCAGLMYLVTAIVPILTITIPARQPIAFLFVLTGVIIALSGIVAFRKAATTINPSQPERSSRLVTSGIYRISRNPMYLGLLLTLLGWAVFLGHLLAPIGIVLFIGYMTSFQIKPEEKRLLAKFKTEYRKYRQNTRRWI